MERGVSEVSGLTGVWSEVSGLTEDISLSMGGTHGVLVPGSGPSNGVRMASGCGTVSATPSWSPGQGPGWAEACVSRPEYCGPGLGLSLSMIGAS